ncbi:superoxide dismutase family protein [Rhodococcus yananensis]|uniref:superoxide dismutase family protein n=1 Tax=Rhodococcus yananensis TaxID=2879464 RepID=UPI001CF8F631|nr:superoxide dismutase family protein [Rhodococcus yananensis]
MNTRRTALISGVCLAALVTAACSDDGDEAVVETPPVTTTTATTLPTPAPGMSGDAFQLPETADADAFTYDDQAVPVGSTVDIDSDDEDGRTTVTLAVTGLEPNRAFGVHVHTQPCGPEPADSGPHYQNNPDPAATPDSPSTDPAYANPQNEVWLDITTDAYGDAQASSTVDWEFRDGEARSVVIHDHHTMTGPGEAGTAGDRLACIDEDF